MPTKWREMCHREMKSLVFLAIIPVLMLLVPNVYAGGTRGDYDERYEDVPGAKDCWFDGYDDGLENPFNHDRNEECIDKGNQYYRAFIFGCIDAGNTEETCKKFTDD